MATLVSPGVSVTVTDESFYVSSGPGTVPFVMIATQENKPVPTDSSDPNPDTAVGTLKANAGALYLISSQRELLQTFGNPIFYSEQGTPIHGSPINEYGLLATHSYMGIANRTFVMRADIDTYQLQPSSNPLAYEQGVVSDSAVKYWVDFMNADLSLHLYTNNGWVSVDDMAYYDVAQGFPSPTAAGEYVVERNGAMFSVYVSEDSGIIADGNPTQVYEYIPVRNQDPYGVGNLGRDFQFSTSVPSSPSVDAGRQGLLVGDNFIWSAVDGGFSMPIGRYNEEMQSYDSIDAPLLATDEDANSYYGDGLTDGAVYIRESANGVRGADVMLYEYDELNSLWKAIDSEDMEITFDGYDPLFDRISQLPNGLVPVEGSYWHDPDPTKIDILVAGLEDDGEGGQEPAWLEFEQQLFVQPDDPLTIPEQAPVTGDVWLDTNADPSLYPMLHVLDVSGDWVILDNSDSSQIIFADARPTPIDADGSPTEFDADVPNPALYDGGTILFNTRYSGMNVKQWNVAYEHDGFVIGDRWVSASGLREDGSLKSGDEAVKSIVVTAMKEAMASSEDIRSESIFYNLIATPGYTELIPDMLSLNVDRKEQAFVIGDSPFNLAANGTDIQAWATNANLAATDGEDGLVSTSPYLGVWYPGAAYTTNLDGTSVVAPGSHIMLRTMAYNDQVAYQWFAPAGLQRGPVTNATTVGYLDDEGEFVVTNLSQGLRDILYVNNVNPIAFIPNRGLHVWGQKTRSPVASALDRVNVARLINYIRYQTENASYPYLFEPNDDLTRRNVKATMDTIMANLITLRGLTDFLVVCDESNNTADRIDRNELWVDIAIIPTKAVEFIYIPIRIKNTGEDLG